MLYRSSGRLLYWFRNRRRVLYQVSWTLLHRIKKSWNSINVFSFYRDGCVVCTLACLYVPPPFPWLTDSVVHINGCHPPLPLDSNNNYKGWDHEWTPMWDHQTAMVRGGYPHYEPLMLHSTLNNSVSSPRGDGNL